MHHRRSKMFRRRSNGRDFRRQSNNNENNRGLIYMYTIKTKFTSSVNRKSNSFSKIFLDR